ncbi:MAG: hypothetical protein V8R14_05235 [Clostridia bacterium]
MGINYIILQDYANGNIRILDIYGIKSMYVYYSELVNPYEVATDHGIQVQILPGNILSAFVL